MRRITSALGFSRSDDTQKRSDGPPKRLFHTAPRPTTYLSRSSVGLRASESTPALVHHIPDSSSSSGVRTPSDVEAADLLAVPMVHTASASTDSVAHSTRSSKSLRWLPVSLIRSLSRKRRPSAAPPPQLLTPPNDLPDDASSDSHSTHSSRPRSPPSSALLPMPVPPFAAPASRRMSSPVSSIYRAGLANVQRRAPPSRANLALQAFTQPLVLSSSAATPHPLTAPDPTSPAVFPRSVSRAQLAPSHSLRIHVHRARLLRRLEEGTLTAAEESSIMPFTARTPRSPVNLARRARATAEEAVAELGAGTGRWSRGLRRWVARPVFEDRMSVFSSAEDGVLVDIVHPARGLETEMLDFSDGTLAMAGLALDSDDDSESETSPLPAPQATKPPLQIQTTSAARRASLQLPSLSPSPSSPGTTTTAPVTPRTTSPGLYGGSLKAEAEAAGSGSGQGRKAAVPAVRGVRFADDEDATDGDDLPLAVLVAVQKKRAEREARARHQKLMKEQTRRSEHEQTRRHEGDVSREAGPERGRDNKRSYAEEIARARMLRDSARAGVERPAAFVREAESKRESLSPARGHSRTGSGAVNSHRRRNTVGEAMVGAPTVFLGPVPPLPGMPTSASSPNFPPSPGFPMAGLPSSAPSTTASFPAGFGSGSGFPSPSAGFSQLPHSNSSPIPRTHSQSSSVSGLPSPHLPFAARSLSSSPLRASFALSPDEFGVASNAMMTNNATMFNNAMMANNAAMMAAHSAMISNMGMPSPPFAGSASGSTGRGRSSAYGPGSRSQSQGWSAGGSTSASGRPGPSPMQMSGSVPGDRRSTAGDRRSTAGDRRSTAGDRRSTTGDTANAPARSYAQPQTQPRRGGHAHSRSEHSMPGRRASKLSTVSNAPPVPALSVPTGIYSSRSRPRPGAEVIT